MIFSSYVWKLESPYLLNEEDDRGLKSFFSSCEMIRGGDEEEVGKNMRG